MSGGTVVLGKTTRQVGLFGKTNFLDENDQTGYHSVVRYGGIVRDLDEEFYFFDNATTDPAVSVGVGETYTGPKIGSTSLETLATVNMGNLKVKGGIQLDNITMENGIITCIGVTTISDRRKKTNISPITNALDLACSLEGVTYEWKDKKIYGSAPRYGFIAQDVEKVIPNAVNTDSDGNKSVNYTDVVPILINAVKTLTEKVVSLEETIEKLKA